jgi:hypothetical protein
MLGRRKKLPKGKSELACALVGPSSAYSIFLPASPPPYAKAISCPEEFSRSPVSFLNYMSSRELEQFYKHLKLRCPWVLEPSLAGLTDAI